MIIVIIITINTITISIFTYLKKLLLLQNFFILILVKKNVTLSTIRKLFEGKCIYSNTKYTKAIIIILLV